MEHLALPFLLKDGYLSRANLQESLTYSVGLILSTRVGSMRFEPEFGCQIWDKEFSDLYTSNKANIRANLRNAIDRFEKRLYNVSVDFTSAGDETSPSMGLRVRVNGNYNDGDKEQKFEGTYLLS